MEPGSNSGGNAPVKNILHIVIIAWFFLFTAYAVLVDTGSLCLDKGVPGFFSSIWRILGLSELFSFVGAIAFVLFGLAGIYEFAYVNGISPLVPPFYLRFKEKRDEKMAAKMMELYYKNNIAFIQQYEKERIGFVLQSLGLDEAQFHNISYELVKARVMPEKTADQLAQKLKAMIYQEKYIIDQSQIPICDRVYRAVDYYIDLYTALYDPALCGEVGRIMASYILICLEQDQMDIQDIDYLIVPSGGNLLLGLEVGKLLRKQVIAVLEEARILRQKLWDGSYECRPGRANNIIVLNDVLVSGGRIYKSVEKLTPRTYAVKGMYCLVEYVHQQHSARDVLKSHGIEHVHCLLQTTEMELGNVRAK